MSEEKKSVPDIIHEVTAWIFNKVIMLAVQSLLLMVCWNYALTEVVALPELHILHAAAVVVMANVLVRDNPLP